MQMTLPNISRKACNISGRDTCGIEAEFIGEYAEYSTSFCRTFSGLKTCEDYDCAVFVHPWDMELGGRYSKFWLPWLVGMPAETATAIVSVLMSGVLQRFPRLKLCFAHGGGSFPYTAGRVDHGFRCRPDICAQETLVPPSEQLGKFWCDSLVHDGAALDLLTEVIGKKRVIFGSDYPFPLGDLHGGKIVENLSDSQLKDDIFAGNALEFLGLERSAFE